MTQTCDCGAATEGFWGGVHEKGCASLSIENAAKSLERAAERLRRIAEMDGPPSLIKGEADLITKRVEQIRAALLSEQQESASK
jgi:hypothetical protein